MSKTTRISHVGPDARLYSSPASLISIFSPVLSASFCLSFLFPSLFPSILKGTPSKFNTVSLSMWQLQSARSVARPVDALTHLLVV